MLRAHAHGSALGMKRYGTANLWRDHCSCEHIDSASLSILDRCICEIEAANATLPLLIVLGVRSREGLESFATLRSWIEKPFAHHLELPPLDEGAMRALIDWHSPGGVRTPPGFNCPTTLCA